MDSVNDPYELSVGVPSVAVFRRLRTDAGLSDKVSLEVRAGFHHALGSRPALSGTRLHELVDALA
ncbi:hypothetical protein ADL00_11540, partial [Streptomyces sp. AS58]